jgi:hypothetical protein
MVCRLTISVALLSIILLRSTLTQAGMCCRKTEKQTSLAKRAGQKLFFSANHTNFACRV